MVTKIEVPECGTTCRGTTWDRCNWNRSLLSRRGFFGKKVKIKVQVLEILVFQIWIIVLKKRLNFVIPFNKHKIDASSHHSKPLPWKTVIVLNLLAQSVYLIFQASSLRSSVSDELHAFFSKQYCYKQHQPEIGKKNQARPWGWMFAVWKLVAFCINVIFQE